MADSFFDRFGAQVVPPVPVAVPLAEQAAPPRPVPSREVPASIGVLALIPREPLGLPIVAWIGGAIYLFMLVLILGSML
jgi:hypothetical protein